MNTTHAIAGGASVSIEHRHPYVRVLSLGCGAALFVFFLGWSLSGPAPARTPGFRVCREASKGTTEAFITGQACPPSGFSDALGYEPRLVKTPAGWRYTRPVEADGRCNGPLGGFAEPEFEKACQAHDYGYDLVRFGVGVRAEADELLYRDMMTICFQRGPLVGGACRCLAHWTKTVLEVGDVAGMDPNPLRAD